MNSIKSVFCLMLIVHVSANDRGFKFVTKANHDVPISDYNQQEHRENAEINQEIYIHESNSNDDDQHNDEELHGRYEISHEEPEGLIEQDRNLNMDRDHNSEIKISRQESEQKHEDFVHHPAYKYEYGVHDPNTKDHKSQWEQRDGDVVKGGYTIAEPDGTMRKVSYSSDKHSGFTANVEIIGQAVHPYIAQNNKGQENGKYLVSEDNDELY